MFGIQFYPTPKPVVEMMMDKVEWSGVRFVLEPSAGKGDIVDGVAQERVTERGELLPCMICGGKAVLTEKRRGLWGNFVSYYVKCKRCGSRTETSYVKEQVVETWNNRCTLLTPEQFKRLECEGDDAH